MSPRVAMLAVALQAVVALLLHRLGLSPDAAVGVSIVVTLTVLAILQG